MFKPIIAAGILLASALAFGQGACYPAGVVLLDTGRPANGATVRVCTSGSTGSPCTPAASLFTDPTLGTPLGGSPVVTTDAHGNFGFCAAAGVNYDLQISGTGITTLNIKNLPLPPTTPIAAASLTSSSANPATVGQIKLASGDCLDWRNNANSGNIQLCKTGAAAGNVPADTFDMTASFSRSQAFIDNSANPASAGVVRCGNAVGCVEARNASNSADLILIQADASNNAQIAPPIRQVEQAAPSGIGSSDQLWADSTDHRWKMNNNNGGVDKVVGAATSDQFQNKALQASGSGNSVDRIDEQGPLTAVTGTGADVTLYSTSISANVIGTSKGIQVTMFTRHTTGSGAVTYKLKLGATTIESFAITSNVNVSDDTFTFNIWNNSGVQNAQHWSRWGLFIVTGSFVPGTNHGTSAENTANALTLAYTMNAAGTEQVTPIHWIVKLIQ